jgi:hypothetical protein
MNGCFPFCVACAFRGDPKYDSVEEFVAPGLSLGLGEILVHRHARSRQCGHAGHISPQRTYLTESGSALPKGIT